MVPVKDPAGGAASVFHDEPEGAPDQHADQIADIESGADHKQCGLADNAGKVKDADHCQQRDPQQHHLVGSLGGGGDMGLQSGGVDLLSDGAKAMRKEFHGAQGQFVSDGDDLQDHIQNPDRPEQMKRGEGAEEIQTIQNGKTLRPKEAQRTADQKDKTPADQPKKVSFAGFGHGNPLSMYDKAIIAQGKRRLQRLFCNGKGRAKRRVHSINSIFWLLISAAHWIPAA